jgi:hypothetical protein
MGQSLHKHFLTVIVLMLFSQQPLTTAMAGSARQPINTDERIRSIKHAADYLVAHTIFPVTIIAMSTDLVVEIDGLAWNEWSRAQQQEFADGINDLAVTGSGGIAIQFKITAGGMDVARSKYSHGNTSTLILRERIPEIGAKTPAETPR